MTKYKGIFALAFLCWLLISVAAQGQGNNNKGNSNGRGRGRRERGVNQFFPKCLGRLMGNGNDGGNTNRTTFLECIQERADERCMTVEMAQNIDTCVQEELETLQEQAGGRPNNGNGNQGNGNGNGNANGNQGNGNQNANGNQGNGSQGGDRENNDNNGGRALQGANGNGNNNGNGNGNGNGNRNGNNMGEDGMHGNGGMGNGHMNGGMQNGNGNTMGGNMNGMGNGNNGMGNGNMNGKGKGPRQVIMGVVHNCTADFRDCARERLNEDIENMPNCVPESMQNLNTCVKENRQTCQASCRRNRNQTDSDNDADPVISLDSDGMEWPEALPVQSLQNCNGIRNRIFKRVCRRGNCCPECLPQLEEVGGCFLNTVMEHLPDACEVNCQDIEDVEEDVNNEDNRLLIEQPPELDNEEDTAQAIQRGFHSLRRAMQETQGGEEIYDACIEVAPGLNENHRGAEELAVRWDFFDCVVDEMVVIIVNDRIEGETEQNQDIPLQESTVTFTSTPGSPGTRNWSWYGVFVAGALCVLA